MPRIVFWNCKRLGRATAAVRRATLTMISRFESPRRGTGVDRLVLCELASGSDDMVPSWQNLTYRRSDPHQLGYGCLHGAADFILQKVTPTIGRPPNYSGFRGGNNFRNLVSRALAYVDTFGIVRVYTIHAPSSLDQEGGRRALSYLACYLTELHSARGAFPGTQWLLLGDFNVTPANLVATDQPLLLATLTPLIHATAEATYIGKARNRVIDYALSDVPGLRIRTIRTGPRYSDHRPIVVDW